MSDEQASYPDRLSIVILKPDRLEETDKEFDLQKFKDEEMGTDRRRDSEAEKWNRLIQDTKEKVYLDDF